MGSSQEELIHQCTRQLPGLGHIAQVRVVFQAGRSAVGKKLDQQKIDLVAVRVHPGCRLRWCSSRVCRPYLALVARGLKELARLMDLDLLVHIDALGGLVPRTPAADLPSRSRSGQGGSSITNSRPSALYEDGATLPPLRSQVLLFRFWSSFRTIRGNFLGKAGNHCGASAGTVQGRRELRRPVCHRSCTWRRSATSTTVEENNTSRAVPNSMTVLSVQSFPSPATRVKRTGIRTGLASGKTRPAWRCSSPAGRVLGPWPEWTLRIPRFSRVDAAWVPRPAG